MTNERLKYYIMELSIKQKYDVISNERSEENYLLSDLCSGCGSEKTLYARRAYRA